MELDLQHLKGKEEKRKKCFHSAKLPLPFAKGPVLARKPTSFTRFLRAQKWGEWAHVTKKEPDLRRGQLENLSRPHPGPGVHLAALCTNPGFSLRWSFFPGWGNWASRHLLVPHPGWGHKPHLPPLPPPTWRHTPASHWLFSFWTPAPFLLQSKQHLAS